MQRPQVIQSESECGDGQNTWDYALYVADLINLYVGEGVVGYTYWNAVLDGATNGSSHWGWQQNSLISTFASNTAGSATATAAEEDSTDGAMGATEGGGRGGGGFGTFRLNPEYYVLGHYARFVPPGSVRLGARGDWSGSALAFRSVAGGGGRAAASSSPGASTARAAGEEEEEEDEEEGIVVVVANPHAEARNITVAVAGGAAASSAFRAELPPRSLHTFLL